ncbi:DNA adenine methylase [Enterobacter hormaechei]|uniref:DNA adenine methylase n=1 Tax=Enterobacter hormaechei TaxID=158836 RepID=UPI00350FA70A
MSVSIKHPAIRYHGGKFRLASWIISHFPEHRCYVEPFGGGASVLLKKQASEAEVYNDLDGDVVNLFRVLRNPETAKQLIEACTLTPYSRDEFNCAYEDSDNRVEQARRLIVRATMGFGSAGATKGKTGFRLDTKRNSATAQRIWARQPDNLAAVASRFAGVQEWNQGGEVRYRTVPLYTAPPASECLTRPVHPRISSEELDDETLDELIDFRRSTFEYHSQQGNKVQTIIHGVTLTAMIELKERRAAMLQGAEQTTALSLSR